MTFDRYYFTSIFINEVFCPCLQNTCSQLSANHLLQISLVYFYFFSQVEDFKDILVIFKAYRSQKSSYRQFLLTVDIRIHHIVDVCCEFDPRALEWDNTSRVKFCTVSMYTLTEEHTWGTVQLRNDNTFSTIDYESSLRSHIRDRTQINILDNCIEIFVVRVCTIKLQLSFQWYTVGQTAFNTIFDRILRRVDVVVQKL